MHPLSILHVFGTLFLVTGISMVLPLVCSLVYGEGDFSSLLISAGLILALGAPLWWFFRKHHNLGIKDGIFIAAFGWVVVSALSAVIATLMNIGPGFGAVGSSENFAFISDTGKWFLSYNMLLGRLEMFCTLVVFCPSFWILKPEF